MPPSGARRSSRTGRRRRAAPGRPGPGHRVPASQSSSAEPVLDRDDRVSDHSSSTGRTRSCPLQQSRRPGPSRWYAPSRSNSDDAGIERDGHLGARGRARAVAIGLLIRSERLARAVAMSGAKPPSSPTARGHALRLEVRRGARGTPRRPSGGPSANDAAPTGTSMNSCGSRRVVGVRAAVDDVEHRNGEQVRLRSTPRWQ